MKENDWLYEIVDENEPEDLENYVYFTEDVRDENGSAIALCTLSAINWGNMKSTLDFEKACNLAVRGLDELLSYQRYPVIAAELSTKEFRPLGVGIINFAYWMAKHDMTYTNPNLDMIDEWAEAWSFYLIKASNDLAKEKGPCEKVEWTKYGQGIVPIDTRKKEVDTLVAHKERMPWGELRASLKESGIRNATLMALMPAECQSLTNEIKLATGENQMLGKFIEDNSILDINEIHKTGIPGQRYSLKKPVALADGNTAYEVYYNGYQPISEIEMEDGSTYKFTNNHKLLVNRNGKQVWTTVENLQDDDDIVSVNNKTLTPTEL